VWQYGPHWYEYLILWYDPTLKWVISEALGSKTEEYATNVGGVWDDDHGIWVGGVTTWHGDAWWSSSSLTGAYTARGSGHGGATKTVAMGTVVGWQSSNQAGVYTPNTGVTGSKYAGWIKLSDVPYGFTYWSQPTLYNENVTYKYRYSGNQYGSEIWFDGENWILSSAKGVKDYVAPITYPIWVSGTAYATNSKIMYNGILYNLRTDSYWVLHPSYLTTEPSTLWWVWERIPQPTSVGYWSSATLIGTYDLVWPYVVPDQAPTYTPPLPSRTISGPTYSGTNAYDGIDSGTQLMAQVAQWLA
jgi:hypothetical protein